MGLRPLIIAVALLISPVAGGTDVTLAGVFPNKALVQIDGGALQTLSVGQKTSQGVVLLSVEGDGATFEVEGRMVKVTMGQGRSAPIVDRPASVQLIADTRGHFVTEGRINGQVIRFIVDTGATLVMLSASEAKRLGIDYRKGARAMVNTANGRTTVYRVKLDTVSIGGIALNGVDAAVSEAEQVPVESLLGMSFLNRTDMERKGDVLTLTKRF